MSAQELADQAQLPVAYIVGLELEWNYGERAEPSPHG